MTKLLFPFSMILGLISGALYPSYIQLGAESLPFDYKTGDSRPLYFLSLKNIGTEKVRMDISTNVGWIFIAQEGTENDQSIQLNMQYSVNFILDIRTDLVTDGQHLGEITVDAVDIGNKSTLETKKISVVLNKNFIPTPTLTPIATISDVVTPTATEVVGTVTPTVTPFISQVPTATPSKTPAKTPVASVKVSPSAKTEPTVPTASSVSPTVSQQPAMPTGRQVVPIGAVKSVWQKIAEWFWKIF